MVETIKIDSNKGHNNLKIVLAITVSFFIAFSFLLLFMNLSQPDSLAEKEKNFYAQHFNDKKRLFIIGSSHAALLNTTFINEFVSSHNEGYVVYNLAYNGDSPITRSGTLDEIISAKPTIIFYGVEYRDFQSWNVPAANIVQTQNQILSKNQDIAPDLHDFFLKLIPTEIFKFNLNLINPKLVTLTWIQSLFENKNSNDSSTNLPFYVHQSNEVVIASDAKLQKDAAESDVHFSYLNPPKNNQQFIVFEKMIEKMKDNNIKVVVFDTPEQRYYLEALPESQKKIFRLMMEELQSKYDVMVYDLTDKYADLPIFINTDHVAYNKQSAIYSQDIAKMILNQTGF